MAKRWAFYKSVCIIDIVLTAIFLFILLYTIFIEQRAVHKDDIYGLLICLAALSICVSSDISGIRLVNKFSFYEDLSNVSRRTLIIFYILLCLLFILMTYLDFDLFKDFFTTYSRFHSSDFKFLLFASVFLLLSVTTLYKIIFTWIIVKAVKKNSESSYDIIDMIGHN